MLVVTGATGKLGSRVIQHLPRVDPSSMAVSVRDPSKVEDLASKGIRVRKGDYTDPQSILHAFEGADRVLIVSGLALGEECVQQHRTAIEAAKKAGVKTIFYTSHSAASANSPFVPARDHYATEQILEQSGLDFVSLRDGFHMDTILLHLRGVEQAGKVSAPKDRKWTWTSHDDIAEAIAILMTSTDKLEKYITLVNSEALDLADVVQAYNFIHKTKVEREEIEPEAYMKLLTDHGVPAKYATMFVGSFEAAQAGEFNKVDGKFGGIVGKKGDNGHEFLRERKIRAVTGSWITIMHMCFFLHMLSLTYT